MLPGGPKVDNAGHSVAVLSIEPIHGDQDALTEIFVRSDWSLIPNSKWTLTRSTSPASAIQTILGNTVPFLVCGCDDHPDMWKELLAALSGVLAPPALIVTSRTADERLWAEALNCGAYDVLAKPFDHAEVVRTLCSAWLHWRAREPQRITARLRAVS